MKKIPILFRSAAVVSAVISGLVIYGGEPNRDGWRRLWDGRTTEGWRGAKAEAFPADVWRMENGELSVVKADPTTGWRGADIVTRERFSNFELVLEFKLSPGANSGIKYFVDAGPGQGGRSSLGLEYQLVDDERHPDARQGRNGNRKLAALYDLLAASENKPARPAGGWNEARIVARGERVEHWLNGEKVLDYDRFSEAFRRAVAESKYAALPAFGRAVEGHILLQDHGDEVWFRNVRIRRIDPLTSQLKTADPFMHTPISRRKFVSQAATAGAGLMLMSRFASAAERPPSANGRLRIAIAGTNARGLAHVQCFTGVPNVEVAYICDVDDRAIAKGLAEVAKAQTAVPEGVRDFRRALDDKDVDAISIATPDHWHAPMAILALAAGKHVFVEKPCSHNPREGELLIEAARRSGRVVQMGNQRRSFPAMQEAIAQIRSGAIGRPYFGRGWYANTRASIGRGQPTPVPEWLDFELWQGPAPRRAFVDNLVHYNWHWHWHWGTGEALNNGTHEMDVCRWALGVAYPTKVTSSGGRFHFEDDWETPDTQTIGWEFPGGVSMAWEGRSCNGHPVEGRQRGALIHGTAGTALLDGEEYAFYDLKGKLVRQVKSERVVDPTNTMSSTGLDAEVPHFRNFVEAIRDGAKLNAPIADANPSVTMLHLGNIAQRVGRTLQCDPATGRIQNDVDAMKLWGREYAPGWEPKV